MNRDEVTLVCCTINYIITNIDDIEISDPNSNSISISNKKYIDARRLYVKDHLLGEINFGTYCVELIGIGSGLKRVNYSHPYFMKMVHDIIIEFKDKYECIFERIFN